MKFNPEKHYLGTLCKRGHEWENSGKSLRYIKSNQCIKCLKITNNSRSQKIMREIYLEKNKEKIKLHKKLKYKKDRTAKENKTQKCQCGCEGFVYKDNKFISGHNSRLRPKMTPNEKNRKAYIYNKQYQQKNSQKAKEWKEKWYKKNKNKPSFKKKNRDAAKKASDELNDSYIKRLYREQGFKKITQRMIQLKRMQIAIERIQKQFS